MLQTFNLPHLTILRHMLKRAGITPPVVGCTDAGILDWIMAMAPNADPLDVGVGRTDRMFLVQFASVVAFD